MRYWLSDVCLVLAQWLAGERPLNRAGRIGTYTMLFAGIVWAALACTTADSPDFFWATWWWSIKIVGIMAGAGLVMVLVGACLAASRLPR